MFRAPLQIDLPSTCSLLPFASSSLSSSCSNSGLQFSTEASTCTWKKCKKYRVSQKKVWFVAHDAKLYLFCGNSPEWSFRFCAIPWIFICFFVRNFSAIASNEKRKQPLRTILRKGILIGNPSLKGTVVN